MLTRQTRAQCWSALGLGLLAATGIANAAFALAPPELRAHVNDQTQLLGRAQAEALEQKLMAYEERSGHQFVLLSVPSLEGDSLEEFSIRVAERWKLGRKGKDDGLILVIVPNEHEMRIEVGYGLEGVIPDAIASRVVRDVLAPAFKRSDFAGGINAAFDALMRAAGDPSAAARSTHEAQPQQLNAFEIIALVLFLLFGGLPALFMWSLATFGSGGRRVRSWGGGFGSGGGFGGGGGGGGWGGGGGGSFGGGGASGSW